jgi:hypothetical protein
MAAAMQVREIIGEIRSREVIAEGFSVKIRKRLERFYGRGNWKKMKGIARVRLSDGSVRPAEIHWFEARGIGKRNIKVKHYL